MDFLRSAVTLGALKSHFQNIYLYMGFRTRQKVCFGKCRISAQLFQKTSIYSTVFRFENHVWRFPWKTEQKNGHFPEDKWRKSVKNIAPVPLLFAVPPLGTIFHIEQNDGK